MIIKAIFDLKQEVDNLKARLDAGERPVTPALRPAISPVPEPDEAEWQGSGEPVTGGEIGKIVDISAGVPKNQNLSVEKAKLDMIVKALEKHDGNRKLAALDLGVPDRTLYRWIAKYNLGKKYGK